MGIDMVIKAIDNEFSRLYACDFQHGEKNLNPYDKNSARQELPIVLIIKQTKPNTSSPYPH